MGIRTVRTEGDECLRKVCKPVKSVSLRTRILIEDMFDTMYESGGVGLEAPQIGVLKRIVVMDTDDNQHVLINPQILEVSGEQTGYEGCLSIPGKSGIVTRPDYVKVKALNERGEEYVLEGEGLLARCICHECDHLDGILYSDKAEGGHPVVGADNLHLVAAQLFVFLIQAFGRDVVKQPVVHPRFSPCRYGDWHFVPTPVDCQAQQSYA